MLLINQVKMANKKDSKEKLTKAEELGPEAFTSQKDYEEQVALEKEAEEKPEAEAEEKVEEKPDENK